MKRKLCLLFFAMLFVVGVSSVVYASEAEMRSELVVFSDCYESKVLFSITSNIDEFVEFSIRAIRADGSTGEVVIISMEQQNQRTTTFWFDGVIRDTFPDVLFFYVSHTTAAGVHYSGRVRVVSTWPGSGGWWYHHAQGALLRRW